MFDSDSAETEDHVTHLKMQNDRITEVLESMIMDRLSELLLDYGLAELVLV